MGLHALHYGSMWFFRSPQVVFGEDALLHIRELRGKRAFVVTDAIVREAGLLTRVLFQLQHAGIESRIFDEVESEPALPTIENGVDIMDEYDPDWIVAVGGGSVMDAAKAMWLMYENPDIELDALSPMDPVTMRARARMLAVPTTAGTGSEATWSFVITVPGDKDTPARKMGSGHPLCMPDYAVVDPMMSMSLPARATADTGMDALTQAIEGWLATWNNDFSDGMCLIGAKLVFENLAVAVANPEDFDARERMANAATLGGLGTTNAMAGLAHAMGQALGAAFKLPHGRAVGLCLPGVLEFHADADEGATRAVDLSRFLGGSAVDEHAACFDLAARVRDLAREIGQPLTLSAAGISDQAFASALDTLVDQVMSATEFVASPRQPDEAQLRALFEALR